MTLLNRVRERAFALSPRIRQLAVRARSRRERPFLVVIPSVLGTRLVDARGNVVWGSLARLYAGPALSVATNSERVLADFPIVPGLFHYDVFGGLVRFLERQGGYLLGRDLDIFAYDWRSGFADAASRLDKLVARVRDAPIDLVCVSTGGLVARHWLARAPRAVRRVVYIGTPHRGAFTALSYLVDGVRPAPGGRWFAAREVATLQTVWDALPHPDERVFVDTNGRLLDDDLYEPATWQRFANSIGDVTAPLAHARAGWLALDAATTHPPSVAIGGRHLATLERAVVRDGRATIPPCSPQRNRGVPASVYEPGDSGVSARSLRAVPGLAAIRYVTPTEHRTLPADRDVHYEVLDALLAADLTSGAAS